MRDMKNNVGASVTLAPATRTTDATGTGVDRTGYESVTLLVQVGLLTMGEYSFPFKESDDDITYTTIAAADLIGDAIVINDASDDEKVYRLGYKGKKKYVRGDLAVTAQSPSITTGLPCSAMILLGDPGSRPVA